jgi:hypothetical protein
LQGTYDGAEAAGTASRERPSDIPWPGYSSQPGKPGSAHAIVPRGVIPGPTRADLEKGTQMYIGLGTIVLILIIVVVVRAVR